MTSWRDTASQQVQDDLDGLLAPSLGFAQQQIAERREFYPFAVVVTDTGEQEFVDAKISDDWPDSATVIASLATTLISRRDRLRAVAVISDTRVPGQGMEAIRVALEHREGVAIAVLLPYSRRRFHGGLEFGQLQGAVASSYIW